MADPKSASKPESVKPETVESAHAAPSERMPLEQPMPEMRLSVPAPRKRDYSTVPFWLGLSLSVAWIVTVATALVTAGENNSFGGIPLTSLAIGLSAVASPVALIWMITAYLQRASDVQVMTEPLRRQLNFIIGENSVAENRIRRFNAAIREQIDLLRQGSRAGEEEIVNLLQQLAWEREEVKKIAMHRMAQLHEAGKITQAAEVFDAMLASKLKLIEDIEARLQRGNGQMLKNADYLRDVLSTALQDIKEGHQSLERTLAGVKNDSVELRDSLHDQEEDILQAHAHMRDIMAKGEKEFEAVLDRFYDRSKNAGAALNDAAATLDEKLVRLERAGEALPQKLMAAAEQISAATANYQIIEQATQQTAQNTAAILDAHAKEFSGKVEGFGKKIQTGGKQIDEQTRALAAMLERIAAATNDLEASLKSGASRFDESAETSLARFASVTAQVKSDAQSMVAQLLSATQHYETAAGKALTASGEQRQRMDALRAQLADDMRQLQTYETQATGSVESLQNRTDATLVNLQDMEERLHALNGTLAQISAMTQKQLQEESGRQNVILQQLAAAATDSVQTLQNASRSLGAEQEGLAVRAAQSETQLRSLIQELVKLHETSNARYEQQLKSMNGGLNETAGLLRATERQLQDFGKISLEPITKAASQVAEVTAKAQNGLGGLSNKLEAQAGQVGQFAEHIGKATQVLEEAGSRNNTLIGTLLGNLLNLGKQQDELSQKAAQRFEQSSRDYRVTLESLTEKTDQLGGALEGNLVRLAAQGEKFVAQTAESEAALQARAQEIENLHEDQAARYERHLEKLQTGVNQTTAFVAEAEDQLRQFSDDTLKAVTRAATRINDSVTQGSVQLAGFTEALDGNIGKMAQFEQRLQEGGEKLETTASKSNGLIGTLLSNLLNLGQKQETLLQETEQGMTRAGGTLSATLEQIGAQTARTVSQLGEANETIGTQSRNLLAQTAEAEQLLQQRAEHIQLLHSEQNLRYAQHAAQLQDGLRTTGMALEATEARMLRFSADTLAPVTQAATQIRIAADESGSAIAGLGKTLDQQGATLTRFKEEAQQAQTALEEGATRGNAIFGALLSNLLHLGQKQEELVKRTESGFVQAGEKLGEAMDDIGARNRSMLAESHAASEALQQRLAQIETVHEVQTQRLAGHLAQVNKGLHETGAALEKAEQQMQRLGHDALHPVQHTAEQIAAAAARGAQSLDGFASRLEKEAEKFAQYDTRIQQAGHTLENTATRSGGIIGTLLANLLNLGQKQDELAEKIETRLHGAGAKLHGSMDALTVHTENAAHKIEAAAEQVGAHGQTLAAQAATTESQLLRHAQALQQAHQENMRSYHEQLQQVNLGIKETGDTLEQAKHRLKDFTAEALAPVQFATGRIIEAAEKGGAGITHFTNTLMERAHQIEAVHEKLAQANNAADSATVRNGAAITALLADMLTLNQRQEELAQKVEQGFARATGKLSGDIETLQDRALGAAASIETAQERISAQSLAFIDLANQSVGSLQDAGIMLEGRGLGLHDMMQNKLGGIAHDLARLESRFVATGDLLQQKADAAYVLMDQAGNRFHGLAHELDQVLGGKTAALQDIVTTQVQQISLIGDALQERLQQIGAGHSGLQEMAEQLGAANERIIAQLSRLHSEGAQAGRILQDNAGAAMAQIAEANAGIERQQQALRGAADHVMDDLTRVSGGMEAQVSRLADINVAHDAQIRILNDSLAGLDGQGQSLREAMSRHTESLLAQLQGGVGRLQQMSGQLQDSVAQAMQNAGQAQERFSDIGAASERQLQDQLRQMQELSRLADESMGKLRHGAQEQMDVLQTAARHIAQQQDTLRQASVAQREELLELFDKLAQAHQASAAAAEQTIAALTDVTSQVNQSLAGFSDGAASSIRQVQDASGGMALQTQQIVQQSQDAAQQVRQIMAVTENLAEHARSVTAQTQAETQRLAASVAEAMGVMDGQGGRLRKQSEEILQGIGAGNAAMTAGINDALDHLQLCGSQVRAQIQQESSVLRSQALAEADEMTQAMQALAEKLAHGGNAMRGQAQGVIDGIGQTGARVMEDITALLDRITANNAQIRAQMADHAAVLHDQVMEDAGQMAEAYGQVLRDMSGSGAKLRDQAEAVLDRIVTSRAAMEDELAECLRQFSAGSDAMRAQALQQIMTLREKAMEEAAALGDSLSSLTAQMGQTGDHLQNKAQGALRQIDGLNGAIDSQIGQALNRFEQGTEDMRTRIAEKAGALRGLALEEVSLYGDKLMTMLAQIETGGGDLRQQTGEILSIIGQSRAQITDQFDDLLREIDNKNQAVLGQIAAQSRNLHAKAADETERFSAGVAHLLGQIDGSIGHLRFQNAEVLSSLAQGGTQVKREFAQMLSVIAESQDKVQAEMADYASALRQQAEKDMAKIAEDVTEMLERIDGSGDRLRQQMRGAASDIDLGGEVMTRQMEAMLERIGGYHALIRGQMLEHATQMHDEYARETARMADGLREVMSQMQGVGQELRVQNGAVLENLDQSAVRFSQTARQAAQAVFDQVAGLDAAVRQIGDKLQGLSGQIKQEHAALNEAGNAIGAHTAHVAAETAKAASALHGVLDMVSESNSQTQGMVSHVASQLQGVIIHLREEMQRLDDHSAATAHAAAQVAAQIGNSTNDLLTAGAQIKQEGARLPQVIDIAEERLTRAAAHLRDHAAEAANVLENGTTRFAQIMETRDTEILAQTQKLQTVADKAGEALRLFGHQLADQIGNLQNGSGVLETAQQKLVDQTAAAIAHMAVASDRLEQLRDGADAAYGQMLDKLHYMDGQLQATTKILGVGTQSLSGSIQQLAEVSGKAQQEMMGAGMQYRAQLQEFRGGLQQDLAELHEGVAESAARLEQKAVSMRQIMAEAAAGIAPLLARFDQATHDGASTLANKTDELRRLTEDAAALLLGFGKTLDGQLQHLAKAEKTIGGVQQQLSGALDHSIRQVDVLQEKMEGSRVLAQSSTEHVAGQLQKLSATLQQHIEQLGMDTQQAVGLVDKAGHNWQEQAQNLARIAQQARSEMAAVSYAIDALQQKGDSMRLGIRGHGQDIVSSLNAVIDHMETTGAILDSDDPMVSRIERGLKKIN